VVDTINKLTTATYEEKEALSSDIINELNLLITQKTEKRIQPEREKDVTIPLKRLLRK